MSFLFPLLLSTFFLGLLLLPFLVFTQNPRTRRMLFTLALVLINLGGLSWILTAYAVTGLDGTQRPGFFEVFFRGVWVLFLVLALVNLAAVAVYRWAVKLRREKRNE